MARRPPSRSGGQRSGPRSSVALAPELLARLDERRLVDLLDDPEWTDLDVTGESDHVVLAGFEIRGCRLRDASLVGVDLGGVRMNHVLFDRCDLSGALMIDASLQRVEFRDCRVSGLQLTGARLRDVRFVECRADDMNLRAIAGERVQFLGTSLPRADFSMATIEHLRCFDSDLTAVDFSQAACADLELHGCQLDGLRGIRSIAPRISPDQVPVLSALLLDAHGVLVTVERTGLLEA